MNAVVIEVRRGRDGKLYPPRMPLPQAERDRLRLAAHQLICGRKLSYRQAQAAMREEYGARRSLGQLWDDLHEHECEVCADA